MRAFSNLSFKQKLLRIILASSSAALVLGVLGFVVADLLQFRRAMPRDLRILAQIIADNGRAPLGFNDPKFARETLLASLAAHPRITRAAIYDGEGKVFADYTRADQKDAALPATPGTGHVFSSDRLDLFQPITDGRERLGNVYLQSDLEDLHTRLWTYGVVTLGVMVLALGGSLIVGLWLQRFLARPVEALAKTAHDVMLNNDYGVRALKFADDELGSLTDTFNRMLSHIQTQDGELRVSHEKFQSLINSIPGIVWEAAPDTFSRLFISDQSEALLGYPARLWLEDAKFWESHLHPDDRTPTIDACQRGTAGRKPFQIELRMIAADGRTVWLRESISVSMEDGQAKRLRGVSIDITEQKRAAEQITRMQQELVETSRLAGMAEVATGVLHNVGNVLNSVSVSSTLVSDRLRRSGVSDLRRAAAMLRDKNGQLAQFLTTDPKGKLLPEFLAKVSDHLASERDELVTEMASVGQNIEHIKEIVAMQQTYAKVFGVLEPIPPTALALDALRMNAAAFERHGVRVIQRFEDNLPPVLVDRHKVLQILTNLVRNAKYAMDEQEPAEKVLEIHVSVASSVNVAITVRDNGVGVPPENLTRIFGHGFTTKKDGHGFGLHSGALAAKQMNGRLSVQSDGVGRGASFTLELPAATPASDLQGRASSAAIPESLEQVKS